MALFGKKKIEETKREEKAKTEPGVKLPSGKAPFAYRIIKKPIITEKALNPDSQNKYDFEVFSYANKTEIRKAVERLYNVKVKNVRILNTPGKRRLIGRFKGFKPGFKKAVVTLKEGHTIEVISR